MLMRQGNDAMDQDVTVLAHTPRLVPNSDNAPMRSLPRCRFVKGSGPHFTDEVHQLLRQRLRIACSIAFVAFAVFLIYVGVRGGTTNGPDAFDRSLQVTVVAILGFL